MFNLGVCLLHSGKPLQAFDCLTEAVQIFHTNPRLWLRLAECCIMAHKAVSLLQLCPMPLFFFYSDCFLSVTSRIPSVCLVNKESFKYTVDRYNYSHFPFDLNLLLLALFMVLKLYGVERIRVSVFSHAIPTTTDASFQSLEVVGTEYSPHTEATPLSVT